MWITGFVVSGLIVIHAIRLVIKMIKDSKQGALLNRMPENTFQQPLQYARRVLMLHIPYTVLQHTCPHINYAHGAVTGVTSNTTFAAKTKSNQKYKCKRVARSCCFTSFKASYVVFL